MLDATETGLLRSTDRGATWVQAHPVAAPVSFVDISAAGDILGVGLVQTDETTLDWAVLSNAFGDGYLLHLARDQNDPMRRHAITGQAEMLASQDGGATWEMVARS